MDYEKLRAELQEEVNIFCGGQVLHGPLFVETLVKIFDRHNSVLETESPKSIYEFRLFKGNQISVDRDVKAMQEVGWELAGQIGVEVNEDQMDRMAIPLKRKIN